MKDEVSAGFVLFRKEDGKILFLLLEYSNYFEFPRGNVEKNEDYLIAAKRELNEETGIERIIVYPFFRKEAQWFYVRNNERIRKKVIYFLGETSQKEVRLSFEHKGYRWCTFDEAINLLKFEGSKKVLRDAYEFLKKAGVA